MIRFFGKKVVLIIEDDVQLQQVYLEELSQNGFAVIQATSGQQGLNLAINQKPDLVILDIMLAKGMNGFDVLTNLKQDPRTKGIPVIVLTNLETEEKTAKDMGVYKYLVKSNTTINDVIKLIKSKV